MHQIDEDWCRTAFPQLLIRVLSLRPPISLWMGPALMEMTLFQNRGRKAFLRTNALLHPQVSFYRESVEDVIKDQYRLGRILCARSRLRCAHNPSLDLVV